MTPQELKNSILQLAIQGKLVEQRPEEGTANEMYKKLIIKKHIDLKPINDDEIPFEIPNSWMWFRHNELFEIIGGSQPPKSHFSNEYKEGYIRLYQIRDYGENPVPVYVPKNEVSKFSVKGDILLARYGGSLGKVFWAKDGAYNVALAKVTPLFEGEGPLPQYMYYYYNAPLYQLLVKNNSRSAQAGFNKEDLNNLLLPLPPLAEQKRIVAKIEELLPYIERYEKAWNKLEELNKRFPTDLQKSILQLAIQGKLVEQRPEEGTANEMYKKLIIKKHIDLKPINDDEIPFEIPNSWMWFRHNELFEIIGGSQPPKSHFSNEYKEGYIRLYQIRDYGENPVPVYVPKNEVSKFSVKGDILLARYGGSLGKVFWAKDGAYNVALAKVTPLFEGEGPLPQYMYYYYNAPLYQLLVKNNSRSAQAGFNKEDLNNLLLPLPPLAEQKRIVAKIEELMPLCEKLKRD